MSAQWNAGDKSATITLSDWNGTSDKATTYAGCVGADPCTSAGVRGVVSHSTGKHVFGVKIGFGDGALAGLATAAASLTAPFGTSHWGRQTDGTVWENGTSRAATAGHAYGAGEPMAVAVDFDAGKIWFSAYNTTTFAYEWADGDPAAGTGPSATFTPNTPLHPFFGADTTVFGAEAFADFDMDLAGSGSYPSLPAGFEVWGSALRTDLFLDTFTGTGILSAHTSDSGHTWAGTGATAINLADGSIGTVGTTSRTANASAAGLVAETTVIEFVFTHFGTSTNARFTSGRLVDSVSGDSIGAAVRRLGGTTSLWLYNGATVVYDIAPAALAFDIEHTVKIVLAAGWVEVFFDTVSVYSEASTVSPAGWSPTVQIQSGVDNDNKVTNFSVVLFGVPMNDLEDTAAFTEAFEDNMFFLTDSASGTSVSENWLLSVVAQADTSLATLAISAAFGPQVIETAASSDSIESATFTMYLEAIGLSDILAAGANTTSTYTDSAAMRDIIRQAINQIVADSANGAGSLNLGAALVLVDIAEAVATQSSSYNSVMLVAELIATLEAYNGADAYDITESGVLLDDYIARVEALVALLDEYYIQDVNEAMVSVYQLVTDSADGVTTITSAGSLLNALLNDAVLVTIRINIGGELFTGWVLNTDTLAPSEYQFADLQFNSACKHGDRYLLAADDGIYEFTDDASVETVMTYIKTGKTDFGSDLKKRVVNSYMVYSASGQMVLKVTTSEFGNLVTRNYRMTPQATDTTDTRRIDIGKGIKSRYWQFEVVGEGVDCDIDEIGMLPIVLSRRI